MAQTPKKRPPKGAPVATPWDLNWWDLADVAAIQALAKGKAGEHQQQQALRAIVEKLCDYYGMSFHPDSERSTAFHEGKRFVGKEIVRMTKMPLKQLAEKEHERRNADE